MDDQLVVEGRGYGLEGQIVVSRADAAGREDVGVSLWEGDDFLRYYVNLKVVFWVWY